MRTIKYRMWDKVDKKMSDWNSLKKEPMYLLNESGSFVFMQFTGLQDKFGKEIYEGDIIEYNGWSKAGLETGAFSYKYQVTYDTEKFMFSVGSKMSLYNLYSLERGEIEIIGNIYENPELLTL